jgi:hypothetical protein
MKENIKIIFVDIDCTLLDWSVRPSAFDIESIEELKNAQKKGVKVFFCTARPYHSVKQIKILELFKPDGMVLANGGMVMIGDEVVFKTEMPVKEFEDLCELALSLNANVEGVRPHDCFLIAERDKSVEYLFETYPEEVPPIEDYHGQKVIGCTLFAYKDLDEIILPKLPKDFYYFRYHDYGVDVASVPHIKGEGIKVALKELDISRNNAMAIGDDLADIAMFDEVKYSVAMKNGRPEVIEAAKYVTDTVTNHGVKEILLKLL